MRKSLAKIGDKERHVFTGDYGAIGYKRNFGHYMPTLMLKNIKMDGQFLTDHLWFNYTKSFAKLGQLQEGDQVQFNGRVNSYTKGYYLGPQQVDYDIERPTKIRLLTKRKTKPLPDPYKDKNALVGLVMQTNEDFYKANNRPFDPWYVEQYTHWQVYNRVTRKAKRGDK